MVLTSIIFISFCSQGMVDNKLPQGVIAIVDGTEIKLDEYKDYLWNQIGKLRLQLYIDQILLKKKAKELGIVIKDNEVSTRVEERVQREVEGFFRNNIAKWKEHISRRNQTIGEYKQQLANRIKLELLREKCVLKTRQVNEKAIKARFEKDYGVNGISYDIRQIFIALKKDKSGKVFQEKMVKAREKAERILRELKDNANFEEMVSLYSDDKYSKRNGGRIAYYRPGKYGKEFDAAVVLLTEKNPLSGIVKTQNGFHIIQLLKKRITRFESKKQDIKKILETEKPTASEKYEFIKKLRSEAKIVL